MVMIPNWMQADVRAKVVDDGEHVQEIFICQACGQIYPKAKRKPHTPDEPTGPLLVMADTEHPCPRCSEVARSAPSMHAWVLQLIGFQQDLERNGDFPMTYNIHPGTVLAKALPGYDDYDTEELNKPEAIGFSLMNATAQKDATKISVHPWVKVAQATCREIVADGS